MPSSPLAPVRTIQANLREALRFFGEATPTGEVCAVADSLAIYSGLDYGVFNIALMDLPPQEALDSSVDAEFAWADQLTPAELRRRLEACSTFFRTRSRRWSSWICETPLNRATQKGLDGLLGEFGLRKISTAPGMVTEQVLPPTRTLPAIECHPVDSKKLRETFGGIAAVAFDLPMRVVQAVYYPERAWNGLYRGFVGTVNGEPVSVVAIVANQESLGVYSLATLPGFRRKGYGEALMRAALALEQERTGLSQVVLQSTDAGHRLYVRMGFETVARFSVYLVR